jgi:hypothetical protein
MFILLIVRHKIGAPMSQSQAFSNLQRSPAPEDDFNWPGTIPKAWAKKSNQFLVARPFSGAPPKRS